ncbi:MAG: DUF1153 domain-containing protein [Novosphingobium sp.]
MGHAQLKYSNDFRNDAVEYPTLADLPPRHHARWLKRQKKLVVMAVQSGLLPLHEAMERYELSIEEFQTWNRDYSPQPTRSAFRDYRAGRILHLTTH